MKRSVAAFWVIVVTSAVTLAAAASPEFFPSLGLRGRLRATPDWLEAADLWRPLTANVVHLGLLHLALNMIGLALAGPGLERFVGSKGLLAVYTLAGVTGWMAGSALGAGGSGASPAVAGVLAALLVYALFRRRESRRVGRLAVRAAVLSAVWLLSGPILEPLSARGSRPIEVADWAHLFGYSTGLVMGAFMLSLARTPFSLAAEAQSRTGVDEGGEPVTPGT